MVAYTRYGIDRERTWDFLQFKGPTNLLTARCAEAVVIQRLDAMITEVKTIEQVRTFNVETGVYWEYPRRMEIGTASAQAKYRFDSILVSVPSYLQASAEVIVRLMIP